MLDRYPDLHLLPSCDWERLSVTTVFRLLYGAASRHFASVQLAALAGILISAGVHCISASSMETIAFGACSTCCSNGSASATPHAITVEMWEAVGPRHGPHADAHEAACGSTPPRSTITSAYLERLSREDQAASQHLLLPPLPKQFRERFVPMAEHRAAQRRTQSQNRRRQRVRNGHPGAHAGALSLDWTASSAGTANRSSASNRASSASRRIWCTRTTNSICPANLARMRSASRNSSWRTAPVRLELTIWRPYEFSQRRYTDWIESDEAGESRRTRWRGQRSVQLAGPSAEPTPIHADPHAYFVEVRLGGRDAVVHGACGSLVREAGSDGRNGKTRRRRAQLACATLE